MNRVLLLLILIIIVSCNNQEFIKPNYLAENNLKGNIIEYYEMQYLDVNSPPNKYDSKTLIKLNEDGNVIENTDMGLEHTIKYENDCEIHTIRNKETNLLLNTLKFKTSYKNGILKQFNYYESGKLFGIIEKKFDKKKRIIWKREQSFDINFKHKKKETFKYYDGFTIEIIGYDENYSTNKPTVKSIQALDKFGNIISIKRTLLNRKNPKTEEVPEQVFKYEYDKKGNWTTQYWYTGKDTIPFMKNTRTYVYR